MTVALLVLFVLLQAVAGVYVWRVLVGERRMSWVETAGMGVGIGTALSALAGSLGLFLPVGSLLRTWAWATPALLVALIWLARRRAGLTVGPVERPSRPELWGVGAGVSAGLALLWGNAVNYPLTGSGEWTGYHQDMVFFEALATGTSRFSPWDSIFMVGEDFRYHWLTYAWSGQLSFSANAEPFLVLTRVLPVVALIGTVLVAAAWARRLSNVPWVPVLAAVLIVVGGYVGAVYGAILNFDSPSQALTSMWLLVLLVGFLEALGRPKAAAWIVFMLLMSIAVAAGKFSTIVVAAGGIGLVTLVGVVRRAQWRWRALLLSVAGVAAVGISYLLFVSGSAEAGGLGLWSLLDRASSVQGLNPQTTPRGVMAGTALLLVAMAARWAGVLWLIARRETRGRPETVMGVGLLVVSVATISLVSGGFNDMWFALAASAPLSVLSAVGVGQFAVDTRGRVAQRNSGRRLLGVFSAGWLSAVVVAMIWGTGAYAVGGWRWAAPVAGIVLAVGIGVLAGCAPSVSELTWQWRSFGYALTALVAMATISRPLYLVVDRVMKPQTAPHDTRTFAPVLQFVESIDRETLTTITPGQREAGSFLRSTADVTDIVATNVTLSPLVPALTGLQTYMTGIHYQAPYGRPDALDDVLLREERSWDFIIEPSEETLKPLCDAGVRWVWIAQPRTGVVDWAPWANIAFTSDDVVIVELSETTCSQVGTSVGTS